MAETCGSVDWAAVAQLVNAALAGGRTLTAAEMRHWMQSADPELHGLAFHLLMEHVARVEPMPMEEVVRFALRYLSGCVTANVEGRHRLGRWDACRSIGVLFGVLWREQERDAPLLEAVKQLLATLAISDDANTREAVLLGCLEHLFVDPAKQSFFADWERAGGALAAVYHEATSLATGWRGLST